MRAKELIQRRSGIGLFKAHNLHNNSMWASKLLTIASPQNARQRGENAVTLVFASQNAPNSTMLPTNSFAHLLMMAKYKRSFKLEAHSSLVRSMRSQGCWVWQQLKIQR